jgi:hypothetical protein
VICDLLAFRGYESAYVAFWLSALQHSWAALSLGDRFWVLAVELQYLQSAQLADLANTATDSAIAFYPLGTVQKIKHCRQSAHLGIDSHCVFLVPRSQPRSAQLVAIFQGYLWDLG